MELVLLVMKQRKCIHQFCWKRQ